MNRAPLSRMSGDASRGTLWTITMRARTPVRVQQLSQQDSWQHRRRARFTLSTVREAVAWQSRMSGRTENGMRLLQFFGEL